MATDQHFDVVVVGGGNAALVAALSAHETGARVAILESAPKSERGGNSRFAGAIFRIPHGGMSDIEPLLHESAKGDIEKCNLGPYTREKYEQDMMRTSKGHCDRDQMHVMFEHAYGTVEWMRDHGVKWQLTLGKFFDKLKLMTAQGGTVDMPPGGAMMAMHEGVGLMESLWEAVEKTDINVFYSTPASDLIADGDTIRGVRTRGRNSTMQYFGQVILACGGFEASSRLRRQYLGEGWDLVVVRGTRFNTGAMMEKAISAGAGVTGHFGGCHASPQDLNAPKVGDLSITDKMSRYSYPYAIMVNIEGKRFMDEGENYFALTYAKTGAAIGQQKDATAFQIFDQKTLHLLEPRYITAKPIQDDTLEGLAKKIGVNVKTFCETVRDFNAATSHGKFDALHLDGLCTDGSLEIPKSNWAQPIDQGPFVAYGVTCGITFTYGGLKTDTGGRVLNNEDLHMPGLWAIGEISGGFFAFNYPGGAGLTKGAVFGRIAGTAAATRALNGGTDEQEGGEQNYTVIQSGLEIKNAHIEGRLGKPVVL